MVKNSFALPTQLDQFFPLKPRLGTQPLLVVLMEFSDSQHKSGHDAAYFGDILYGADPSVNGYYKEISYGKFSFSDAAIVGWCTAPRTAAYCFSDTQTDLQYQKLGYEVVRCAMATSGVTGTPHLDPWAKIHLGWIKPVVVTRSGWYAVRSAEKNPEAYILYKPAHGVNEYFIIENRWPPDSFYEMYVETGGATSGIERRWLA